MNKNIFKKIILFIFSAQLIILMGCAGGKPSGLPEPEADSAPEETIVFEGLDEKDRQIQSVIDDLPGENDPDDDNKDDGDMAEAEAEPEDGGAAYDPSDYFYSEDISDELFAKMQGKSYPEGCQVARGELRHLVLLYKDINGDPHEGEMVCSALIADKLIDIFRQLYDADYPIEKMVLIDEYDGDDDASMRDNNTSCFNYRVVSGTNKISKHGYGLAVDLNPRYNPYIHKINGEEMIEPENGTEYADRSADFDYKIDKDDLAYKLFTQAGFTWGGSWKNSKDYQHFQM